MGGGKSGMTFWDPQARGAVPVQARKVGQPSTHTDPHGPASGPGRNQARSSEEGECQRGVLLEHFHFQLGWEMGNARGPCMQTFRGTLTDMVPQSSRLILGKEGSIHTRIVRNRRNAPSHAQNICQGDWENLPCHSRARRKLPPCLTGDHFCTGAEWNRKELLLPMAVT
jgi:hypothetical protein